MKTNIFIMILFFVTLIFSCSDSSENKSKVEVRNDEIITTTFADLTGKKLVIIFNHTKNIATLKLDNETIELNRQRAASGIWYKNENYKLRGKGDKIELQKKGKIVFKN